MSNLAGLATASAMLGPAAFAAAQQPAIAVPPIVDPHVHLWDLKQFRLAWLDNAGPVLKRDFLLADYLTAVAGLNVTRAVYVEVSVAAAQREAEADFAAGLCTQKDSPFGGVVVGGVPGSDGFRDYIAKFKANPRVRGVRCSYPRGSARNDKFLDDLRFLGDQAMTFDLLADASLISEAAEVAAACPKTRFVLDHCGNASPTWFGASATDDAKARATRWREGIKRLGAMENVACKISGVAENGPADGVSVEAFAPVVNHCLESFAGDRVMYASNWPVCLKSITIARWVQILREITAPRGEPFGKKLFSQNARDWYKLD